MAKHQEVSCERASRPQQLEKPKSVSAPARATQVRHDQARDTPRNGLRTPPASEGTAKSDGVDIMTPAACTTRRGKLLRERKLDGSHGTSSRNFSVSRSLQKAASASIVVHLEDSSPDTTPKNGKRASTASKKRQLMEDSEDEARAQDRKSSSGGGSSDQDEGGDSSGSEFSGSESETSEDAASDISDSEEDAEALPPAKKPKQAKAVGPKPKAPAKAPPARAVKPGAAALRKKQASTPAAGATPAGAGTALQQKKSVPAVRTAALEASKTPQGERSTASLGSAVPASSAEQKPPKSGGAQLAHAFSAAVKSAPQQNARSAGAQPLQERNAPSHGAAAPAKPLQRTGAAATPSPAAAAPAGAMHRGQRMTSTKRIHPGASLSAILSGGPKYRICGLRKAGGTKLHNVGPSATQK
ncbi:hypothetical protein CVIRNUC_001785 [Coccomyxa viridis]|uniref:Uncharacterized protein n=1 Tax=Coccomyxa viridis TaxID=1274662 RepID=A0AAV1HWK3_9CHLO|nr:hypothetical protein CVIRNUC_001785 [Coccomyxa viridis]